MRLLLVANVNASGVEEADDVLAGARAALAAQGAEVEAQATGSVAELRRVLAEAAGRRVVLLGGDGSLHAAANLGGAYRDLALLPAKPSSSPRRRAESATARWALRRLRAAGRHLDDPGRRPGLSPLALYVRRRGEDPL